MGSVATSASNYEVVRPQIKAGDLIALSHYSWANWYDLASQFVRVFTMSDYSHTAVVIGLEDDRLMIVESVRPVIRKIPLSDYLERGFYWLPLPEMGPEGRHFLMSRLGTGKYSIWQGILAQLHQLAIGSDELWECAELVIAARRLSGVELGPVAVPGEVVHVAQHDYRSPCWFISK